MRLNQASRKLANVRSLCPLRDSRSSNVDVAVLDAAARLSDDGDRVAGSWRVDDDDEDLLALVCGQMTKRQ